MAKTKKLEFAIFEFILKVFVIYFRWQWKRKTYWWWKLKSNGKRKRDEKDEEEEERCKYLRFERRPKKNLMRKFRLPENCNMSAISAKCENRVLKVVVEKLPPPPKSKTVQWGRPFRMWWGLHQRKSTILLEMLYCLIQQMSLFMCWLTVGTRWMISSCTKCLISAFELMVKCFPWSEGSALHTGCFIRYSNTEFLNPEPTQGKNVGR